jgi:arsenate reductase
MTEAPKTTHPKAVNALPPQRVLFLCIGNSARSQIAEGFACKMAPPGVEIWSVGTSPSRESDGDQVMEEAGTTSATRPKRLDDVPRRAADTVITLCGEASAARPA